MKSFITRQFTIDNTEHAATPLHFSVIHFPALPCLQSSAVLNLIVCFTPVIETERLFFLSQTLASHFLILNTFL